MFHSFIAHVYDNHINLRFLYIFGGSGLLWGVKLTQLMSIFNFKNWKFLIQIQLTKSFPKITTGVKVPCFMLIRVKWHLYNSIYLLCSVNLIEELEGVELIHIPYVDFYHTFHVVIWFDLVLASENSKNVRALWAVNPNPVHFHINVITNFTHF